MKKFEEMTSEEKKNLALELIKSAHEAVDVDMMIIDIIASAVKEKGLCHVMPDGMIEQFEECEMPQIDEEEAEDDFFVRLIDDKPSDVDYKRKFIFFLEPNDWTNAGRDCYHYVFEIFIEVDSEGKPTDRRWTNTPRTYLDEDGEFVEVEYDGWHGVPKYADYDD